MSLKTCFRIIYKNSQKFFTEFLSVLETIEIYYFNAAKTKFLHEIFSRRRKSQIFERRDWDLNPGGAKLHKISSLAPYQARLSRHTINLVVFYDR